MVSQRNRIINIIKYIESLGISLNIGKNKARGNKGFFKVKGNKYRIDIANNIQEDELFLLLVHEFAHYLHYKYDKSLKSLSFLLGEKESELQEEMISLTVKQISKKSISPLFKAQDELKRDILKTSGITLELKKKALKRINSKISRLNRYYNQPTELFARAMEVYFTSNRCCRELAPNFAEIMDKRIVDKNIPMLSEFAERCCNVI